MNPKWGFESTSIGTNHENFNGVLNKKKKKKLGIQYISLIYLFFNLSFISTS